MQRIGQGVQIIIAALLFTSLLGFFSVAEAATEQNDDSVVVYGEYDYLTQPYGGFGPGAEVVYDEDKTPALVNGYPVRPVKAGFSNLGKLYHFQDYFVTYPFWRSAAQYDGNLACMSLEMSLSANRNADENDPDSASSDLAGELERFLRDAGFTDIKKDDYVGETSMETLGTAIGRQKMEHEGEEPYTLIAIGICGANYSNEWQSNINIGKGDTHAGFADASELVMERLDDYIRTNRVQGRIKIWISGSSRAAAVANLTAGTLVDSGAFPKEDVFAYTFGTPAVRKHLPKKGFENIHNILDPMDAVPQFPPARWGYERYGQDYYIRVQEFVSEYGGLATGVRNEINEIDWDVVNNYSPELNLRMRLLLSMLFETIGNSGNYMDTVYPSLIGIMQNGSTKNVMITLRDLMRQGRNASPQMKEHVDGLVDYILRTVTTLAMRKGYSNADSNTGSLALRLLAEHTQNTYLANVASIRGGLYAESEDFYYVMVRGPVSVNIKWREDEEQETTTILHISPEGEKKQDEKAKIILGEGMTQMLADSLYIERTEDTTVAAIPIDRDLYQVDWTAESSGTVQSLQVLCGADVSILYDGAISESRDVVKGDAGTAFQNMEDGTVLPNDFEKVSLGGQQIAEFLGIASLGLNWRVALSGLCLLAGLLLCVLICLILSLVRRRRPNLKMWGLICLTAVSVMEAVMAYWLLADMPLVWIIWMCIAIIALVIIAFRIRAMRQNSKEPSER